MDVASFTPDATYTTSRAALYADHSAYMIFYHPQRVHSTVVRNEYVLLAGWVAEIIIDNFF